MIDLFESCCSEVSARIDRGDLDGALVLVMRLAEQLISFESVQSRVGSSPRLDLLLQRIGKEARRGRSTSTTAAPRSHGGIVYVATELYVIGGHTRLLEDVVHAQAGRRSTVLLTNANNREAAAIAPDFIVSAVDELAVAPSGASAAAKLAWLQSKIDECGADAVVLLHHNHDAIAVAGVDGRRVRTVFIHHADYTFSLGVHLPDALHVDLHPRRFFACKAHARQSSHQYWPISVPDLGARPAGTINCDIASLVTCSSGSTPKFTGRYPYSYFEEVPGILAVIGGQHVHIGPLSDAHLKSIRDGLSARGISQDKFVHLPWVRSLWRELAAREVGLYIASFPIFSGRATIEALGSGTPVLAHMHAFDSALSDVQLLYPGCLHWRTPPDLHAILRSLSTASLRHHADAGRKWYETQYSPELFKRCAEGLVEGRGAAEPFVPVPGEPDPLAPALAEGDLAERAIRKLGLAQALDSLGMADDTRRLTAEVMELAPIIAEACYREGLRNYQRRNIEQAIVFLSRAVDLQPGSSQYLNSLAVAAYEAGDWQRARRSLEQALALQPGYVEAQKNLELILARHADPARGVRS